MDKRKLKRKCVHLEEKKKRGGGCELHKVKKIVKNQHEASIVKRKEIGKTK